jgi:hypothetical protein
LNEIEVENVEEAVNRINALSHQDTYRFQFNEMTPQQEDFFKSIFDEIQIEYNFRY